MVSTGRVVLGVGAVVELVPATIARDLAMDVVAVGVSSTLLLHSLPRHCLDRMRSRGSSRRCSRCGGCCCRRRCIRSRT
jgi:hypothetical protein